MAKRKRKVGSVATELVKKAREAMLTAVQIYNNPQIDFKAEVFIVTTAIAWTYLMHAHFRKIGVEYRELNTKAVDKRTKFARTFHARSNTSAWSHVSATPNARWIRESSTI
jgi:hypothetical protein